MRQPPFAMQTALPTACYLLGYNVLFFECKDDIIV